MKKNDKVNRSTSSEKQQKDGKTKTLVRDVLAYGDLLVIANKGIGKTNTLMVLAKEFQNLEDTKLIIFEDFPKWCLEFDSMPYMVIHDNDVVETSHTVDMEDYFLRHERDYSVKRGLEIQQALEENKHLIFTSEISDIERQAFFIYSVVEYFYRKAYLRAFKDYSKKERIVFIIEESQNVFDSSTISKKIFNRLRKIFSVARNLDLHFVLCSQRLQDLNTKIRGRTRLLIGQVSIDDYELKVRSLLRHSKHRTDILTLPKGKFLNVASDSIVSFPKFEQVGKPYEIQTKSEQKLPSYATFLGMHKPNILERIVNYLTPKLSHRTSEEPKSVYNEEEEMDSEIEEDNLAFGDN